MSETVVTKSRRKTTADYEAIAAQLLTEMNHLEEQMDKDRAESERLKVETQVIKAETEVIKARTAATLSQLERDREIQRLRLENILLRFERGLPPGTKPESEDEV